MLIEQNAKGATSMPSRKEDTNEHRKAAINLPRKCQSIIITRSFSTHWADDAHVSAESL